MKNKTLKLPPINQSAAIPTTHFYFVVDKSSSIAHYGLTQAVVKAINNRIAHLKSIANTGNHKILFSMISFAEVNGLNTFQRYRINTDIINVNPVEMSEYSPYGNTPLFDATLFAIDAFRATTIGPNDSFLIEVITDGEENKSRITAVSLTRELEKCNKEGHWTIAFQVPKGHERKLTAMGIPEHNVVGWEQTVQGTEVGTQVATNAMDGYFSLRSKGVRSTARYFAPQNLNLKDVNTNQVKRNLKDISGDFHLLEVDKDSPINEFVEKKLKTPYKIGQGKYELVKKEKLQDYKEVFVQIRGEDAIYGGADARHLLGIKSGDVEVDPINLSNLRIFCESRSHNRRLPRGSKLLVEKDFSQERSPVWEN
jgi:hypothetical protein